jgi:signal transduction histidine kinase
MVQDRGLDFRQLSTGFAVNRLRAMRTIATWWRRIGPRLRDVAGMFLSLAATLAYATSPPENFGVQRSAVWLFGLIGTASLWWRRRSPEAVTVLGVVVYLVSRNPIPLGIGLMTVAVARRDRWLLALTVAAAAAFSIGFRVGTSAPSSSLIILGIVAAGFCAATGAYIGARVDLLASLRERADRAEAEREVRAEQARVAERTRIAQEMHDVLAHKVSLIALHAGALEVNADRDQVRDAAALIRSTAREAMEDLRDVLGVLRSGHAPSNDLAVPNVDAIGRLVDASRAAGVRVSLTVDVPTMPAAAARTAHRVVQEGLTNVHKHARGAATCVRIEGDERRGVEVEVVNQRPVGASSLLPGSGAGLIGLRERVALVGGTLSAGPCAGGGWRIAAWLPWAGS